MLKAAKSRASKVISLYILLRSRAGPSTSAAVVTGVKPAPPPFPSQVPTVTRPQTAPLYQATIIPASLDTGTDVFPTNPAPLCSVTDALGSQLPLNNR